jgi:hypothetical protein
MILDLASVEIQSYLGIARTVMRLDRRRPCGVDHIEK